MKIEALLTHQNPLIRQLIKGVLELGYQNIEVAEDPLSRWLPCFLYAPLGTMSIDAFVINNIHLKIYNINDFGKITWGKAPHNQIFFEQIRKTEDVIKFLKALGMAEFVKSLKIKLKMKTIETLLTHQNPLIRQLSKGLLKLGYQNIEMIEAFGSRNGQEEYHYFSIVDIEFRIWKLSMDWFNSNLSILDSHLGFMFRGISWREMVTHYQSRWIESLAEVNDLLRKVAERKESNENY